MLFRSDDEEDGGDDDEITSWAGTTWEFSGTLTQYDSDDGTQSGPATFSIEFPESGGVNIMVVAGEHSAPIMEGDIKIEETVNGVIITNSGSETIRDSEGSHTDRWSATWRLTRTSATQATMDYSSQNNWNGSYYVGTNQYTYSGTTISSGQFTGKRTK